MAQDNHEDDSGRYFFINLGSEYFMLRIGAGPPSNYPKYSIAQYPHLLSPLSDVTRQSILAQLDQFYIAPSPIPEPGRLPDFFSEIQHLVLGLKLRPCLAELRSAEFKSWLVKETKKFCERIVKPTVAKFKTLKHLDLLIEGDAKPRADDRMVLRHWRDASIQDGNGLDFGHAELGLLEMEINLWMMSEYMGKNGPEGPHVRIVVYIPQQCSKTK
jgi:hypothetical protein